MSSAGSFARSSELGLSQNEWQNSLSQEKRVVYMQQEMSPGPGDYTRPDRNTIGHSDKGVSWRPTGIKKRVARTTNTDVPRYMRDTRSFKNLKSGIDETMRARPVESPKKEAASPRGEVAGGGGGYAPRSVEAAVSPQQRALYPTPEEELLRLQAERRALLARGVLGGGAGSVSGVGGAGGASAHDAHGFSVHYAASSPAMSPQRMR